jgi:hypothetical protein
MIVIFSNLIIGVLKKLIITVIYSNSTITNLSCSIFPSSSNLTIKIYKGFIPEFYNRLISIVERKIISVNYSNICFCKFKVNSFTFLTFKYFIFLKLLYNICNENNLIFSIFILHGFAW